MRFTVQRNDIANMAVDAIVLPANPQLKVGPGASMAIFERAGKDELESECKLRYKQTKQAKVKLAPGNTVATHAFALPAKVILHTIVPRWVDGKHNEYEQLCLAYRSALSTADNMGFESLAMPVLASGNNGFDVDLAVKVATESIKDYAPVHKLSQVFLVTFGEGITQRMRALGYDVEEVIDELYVLDQGVNQLKARDAQLAQAKEAVSPAIEKAIVLANEWLSKPEVRAMLLNAATIAAKKLLEQMGLKQPEKTSTGKKQR